MLKNLLDRFFNLLQYIGEKIQNKEFKDVTLQSIPFWIASLVTGLLAVLYSNLFHWAEGILAAVPVYYNWWVFLYIPLMFALAWWIIYRYAPTASGSGIPQLMAAIEIAGKKGQGKRINILLSIRSIFSKIASSVLLLLGGGAIGREGPTIQVSGAIFNQINNWIPSFWPKISHRLMLISGGAAGLGAAFNTPLGGIVFAIEELGKTHLSKMRTQLFISVIIAGVTSQLFLGSYLYLQSPLIQAMQGFGIVYVIVAAAMAGVAGYYFTLLIVKLVSWKSRFKGISHKLMLVLGCGLTFAALVFFTGSNTIGSGKNIIIHTLFSEEPLAWHTFLSRFTGTIVTYVSGGAGGVFAPSLAIGASLGDGLVQLFHIYEFKNLVVISCMIGFMCGVTHSPFTSFILVLEMTNGHSAVFPMMLSAVTSYAVAKSFDSKSLYQHLMAQYLPEPPEPAEKSAINGQDY